MTLSRRLGRAYDDAQRLGEIGERRSRPEHDAAAGEVHALDPAAGFAEGELRDRLLRRVGALQLRCERDRAAARIRVGDPAADAVEDGALHAGEVQ